jgi:hypothetical protein
MVDDVVFCWDGIISVCRYYRYRTASSFLGFGSKTKDPKKMILLADSRMRIQVIIYREKRRMGKTLIVVVSRSSGNRQQVADQERASIWWKAQGIEPELVDGVAEKERRNELFGISDVRGDYPQFFLKNGDDDSTIEFLGLFDDVEAMNEMGTFTKEALVLIR